MFGNRLDYQVIIQLALPKPIFKSAPESLSDLPIERIVNFEFKIFQTEVSQIRAIFLTYSAKLRKCANDYIFWGTFKMISRNFDNNFEKFFSRLAFVLHFTWPGHYSFVFTYSGEYLHI